MKSTTTDGVPLPQRYGAILGIALGITVAVLDGAIANVALPTIARDLNASAATSVWGKIGGNLDAVAKMSSNADRFVYALLANYTQKLQNMRAEANYAPDNMSGQFYYSMAWVNGGCEAMLALDK